MVKLRNYRSQTFFGGNDPSLQKYQKKNTWSSWKTFELLKMSLKLKRKTLNQVVGLQINFIGCRTNNFESASKTD